MTINDRLSINAVVLNQKLDPRSAAYHATLNLTIPVRAIPLQSQALFSKWNLKHNSFISCYGIWTDSENKSWIILEELTCSLTSYLRIYKTLSKPLSLKVAILVAEGMEYLHSLDMVHGQLGLSHVWISLGSNTCSIETFKLSISDYTAISNYGVDDDASIIISDISTESSLSYESRESKFEKDIYSFSDFLYCLISNDMPVSYQIPWEIEKLMADCKLQNSSKRPRFSEIVTTLKSLDLEDKDDSFIILHTFHDSSSLTGDLTLGHALLLKLFGNAKPIIAQYFTRAFIRHFSGDAMLDWTSCISI